MSGAMADADAAKRRAAERAVVFVRDGTVVGLGTGSTAAFAIAALVRRVRDEGLRIRAVPTSLASAHAAEAGGIPLVDLNDVDYVDVTIDGADEIDPRRDLIKGRGGALLREKLVAVASRREIIIADESKLVERLGERTPLPVEVVPFGWRRTAAALERLGLAPALRGDAANPFRTDNDNLILDCGLPPRAEAAEIAVAIKETTGVVEHGFFLGLAHTVIIATEEGVEVLGAMGNE